MKAYLPTYYALITEITKFNHDDIKKHLVNGNTLLLKIASADVFFINNLSVALARDIVDLSNRIGENENENEASLELSCLDKEHTHIFVNTTVPTTTNDLLTMRVMIFRKNLLTTDITYTIPQNYAPIIELNNAINTINRNYEQYFFL